jgi:mannose/fructose/N-acetylgalactosamine-specific phosphotransferase system component IID
MFVRTFFIQALWNYERLQNVGFVFILKPFLDKVYLNDSRKKDAFLRHLGYCNTHPYMVGFVIAIIANIENKIAGDCDNGKIQEIDEVKSTLCAPLAAIGDPFFGGTLRPAVSFVSIFMLFFIKILNVRFEEYSILIPFVFIVIYNVIHITVRYYLMFLGVKFGKGSIYLFPNFKFMSTFIRYSGFIIAFGALVLYFIGSSSEIISSVNGLLGDKVYCIVAYGIIFVFSVVASSKFGGTFLFYNVLFICILMSYLETLEK